MSSLDDANTANVGVWFASMVTFTGSDIGAVGLIHTPVAGSVSHITRLIGTVAAPVSTLTDSSEPQINSLSNVI